MGALVEDFERELDSWVARDAGRPRRTMIRLLLLALEREELVSVAYREAAIVNRLRAMPLDDATRDLIRHAMIWAWKDEEMHATYLRGAIFRMNDRALTAHSFLRQAAGAVGGWAASVRQHVRWRDAPLSRTLATGFAGLGALAGQVPREVRKYLRYRPFRDFCLFNVEAEHTAQLCYERMVQIAPEVPEIPPVLADDFRRVCTDEESHRRVFQILADALDDQNRLVAGETPDTLAQKLGEVGEVFLPRERRVSWAAGNPLGSGGRVWVKCGSSAEEKLPLFLKLLDEAGLPGLIETRAREVDRPVESLRVSIKPTFMLGYHRKDQSMITDPALVDALAGYLGGLGCTQVDVVEAPNIYDHYYRNRSVAEVARYFGYESPRYRLVDLSLDQVPHTYHRGMAQYTVSRVWKEADFRISFPKMRSHPVELAHLTVGNIEWIGARCDEFLFPERQARRETAVMMLLDEFPPHFGLIDAYDQAADGLVGVMGCGRPPSPKRFYAGADALAVDMVAARHMGINDPRESSFLRTACFWFGDPSARIERVGTDEPVHGWRSPYHSDLSTLLSFLAFPVYVWGSQRGALFTPEMDAEAFPLLAPEGRRLKAGRRFTRSLLGLHLPR